MSTPPQSVLSRKQPDPKLEGRVVPLIIGDSKHHQYFFVHEDLICLSSPYFRRAIQPKRKSLEDEADRDCPICYELIDLDQDYIKVCLRKCGTSFHAKCLTDWFKSERPSQPTCPYCRAKWRIPGMHRNPITFPDLSPESYPVYQEWLYRDQICINDTEKDGQVVPGHWTWMSAYFLGRNVEDNKFCQAVLKAAVELCKESNTLPPPDVLEYAYSKTQTSSPLRNLLVSMYEQAPRRMLNETPAGNFPAQFLFDLVHAGSDSDRKPPAEWDVEKAKAELVLDIDHISPPA